MPFEFVSSFVDVQLGLFSGPHRWMTSGYSAVGVAVGILFLVVATLAAVAAAAMIYGRLTRDARIRYLRFPIVNSDTSGHWLLTITYRSAFLLAVYRLWKWFHHLVSGTSELFRVCDAAVARQRGLYRIGIVEAMSRDEKRVAESVVLSEKNAPRVQNGSTANNNSAATGPTPLPPVREMAALVFRIDRCLLYSSKILVEHRQLEAKESNVDEAVASILRKKGFPENGSPSTPQALIFRACANTIASSHKLMHELNARAATKYDSTNKLHERKLLDFWEAAKPDEKLTGRISEQWKALGFQGDDPATDFRGMGMLGLDDLLYFARVHKKSFQRVLESSHKPSWFSMAITGIHITSFCISLVRTRQLQNFLYTFGTTKEVYEEFYCFVFDAFEKEWTSSITPLTAMDFNRMFGVFQVRIERMLLEGLPTVLDEDSNVFARNKKSM
ncbi:ELMO/CED-12 family-domain-containing protein [Zopfochytrium polystomum]|nr:ELMO/CED-12 family-domain-containing protein [Zopfochytrium polystomum]